MELDRIITNSKVWRTYFYNNGWKIEEWNHGTEVYLELITNVSGFTLGVWAENKPLPIAAMMAVLRETANYAVSMYERDFERFTSE